MIAKIVVRYADGKVVKGTTGDLAANKMLFHLTEAETGKQYEVSVDSLKAIFFVKSFQGDPQYQERLDVERVGLGKKIKVSFKDGETLVGYTQGFSPARATFIVFPCDPDSNNEKVFVVTAAAAKVEFI
ncbi:DUF6982 domain-containing protein [Geomonas subterranea]|uniref:Uncharacterized protein n=1 Tax=Geomonas subterranea TaxID=2847989 RepID=A0ABX8LLG0_9BACT|nr:MULTISPECIES: hypothetical protein [Geomonas]QXE92722.1 hypothetical protein KP001_09450 [Geomonas subterranea]QXM09178.1 hypothetical protein KP002_19825 [Geomonas subterranea]